jgi:hypothetical protein
MAAFEDFLKLVTLRRMSAVLFILTFILVFQPIFLPLRITYQTQDFHDRIEEVQPGDTVVFSVPAGPGTMKGMDRDWLITLMNHLYERGDIKLVFHPTSGSWPAALKPFRDVLKLDEHWTYGENYVFLPYSAGEEVAWAAFAADIHGFFAADAYGTPLSQIPMMDDIRSMADVDLAIVRYGIFTWGEMFFRQWSAKYGVDTLGMAAFSTLASWYGSKEEGGLVQGNLDLSRGWAEYEYLRGYPGEHFVILDVRNVTTTITIALVIAGNLSYWITRGREREVEQ